MSFGEPDPDGRQGPRLDSLTGDQARDDAATWCWKAGPARWPARVERLRAGRIADSFYIDLIGMLGRTRLRPELVRAHPLYGEWLRREGSRAAARTQLKTAHQMLAGMGAAAFAERARRELLAAGETVRKLRAPTRTELTAHEASIAQLARDGQTNTEIGAQLSLSARTVEWHLGNVFTKLGITSRRELRRLPPG